jgi:hypothetical protein
MTPVIVLSSSIFPKNVCYPNKNLFCLKPRRGIEAEWRYGTIEIKFARSQYIPNLFY